MENRAVEKNHMSCQTWVGQNGWATPSSQGLFLNPHGGSQHLGLGSPDPGSLFGPLQGSRPSCMGDMSALASVHHAALKPLHMSSVPTSNSLFDNITHQGASHLLSFAQQMADPSSVLATSNQVKSAPSLTLPPPNHELPPCRPPHLTQVPPPDPHKAFQAPLAGHALVNGHQDLAVSFSACAPHAIPAPFGAQGLEPGGVSGFTQSYGASAAQDQPPWSSSHSRGVLNESVPNARVCPNRNPIEEEPAVAMAGSGRSRLSLLQQRAQLLKQLENMNKLLESFPPEEEDGEQPSNTALHESSSEKSESSGEAQRFSPQEKLRPSEDFPTSTCDEENGAQDDSLHPIEQKEDKPVKSDDRDDDYLPSGDNSFSDSWSEDEDVPPPAPTSPSRACSPAGEEPALKQEQRAESEESSSEESGDSPPPPTQKSPQRRSLETMVLPATSTKARRAYDKRNYCLFCSKPFLKVPRHLVNVHSDRAEVAVAFQYPPHSKERSRIWNKLTNEGNFAHNKKVLSSGRGQLAVKKRPSRPTKAAEFAHCIHCHGLFGAKTLFRHLKNCPDKVKAEEEPAAARKRIVSHCALLAVNFAERGISESVKDIISEMVYDEVTRAIVEDRTILRFAEQMLGEHSRDDFNYIRQNLRQTARLVLEAQKTTPLERLQDFFHPQNFHHVVSAVRVLSGYDHDKKRFSCPSLAIKLGYNLQKICGIVEAGAVQSEDAERAESARMFLSVYKRKWNKLVSSAALRNLRELKRKKEADVPLAEDVKLLQFHAEEVHRLAEQKLRERVSVENYAALTRAVLARTILFNRRKTEEVSKISVAKFLSRKRSEQLDDMDVSVSDLERRMCRFFTRIDIRASSGRMVPVLLKPSLESSLELLMKVREECGIPKNNRFLFARPSAQTAYKGSACVQHFVRECRAQKPAALTALQIRRHFAAMLQLINLEEDEALLVLGPDNPVQTLRRDSGAVCDDSFMETGVRSQTSGSPSDQHNGASGPDRGSAEHQGQEGAGHGHRSGEARRRGSRKPSKSKWSEAEVRAVEQHLMEFIRKHRVPQKYDCLQCLDAEPRALRARSWKAVKDYVRNRITTLRRQSGSGVRPAGKSSGEKARAAPPIQTPDGTPAAPPRAHPSDSRAPTKVKWAESEVHAVERHMMRFITQHKVPQKNDCVLCLEAEPQALRARSWRGVKDYVRNRITTLQRQSGSARRSWKKGGRSENSRHRSVLQQL
ncbi:hypothetical protein FQA47_005540 [Oryzias melastigma]|uniref:Uncharacterized protein n=1 Tax=Oryzias melastigma TaxID=30732 RepID=A0A834CF57_ORYME|nr:uncharacterized protein LOC112148571 isoform X3 [Oryzias melastigma]KAF6727488.1 hypothetical protein FQA47_005540 [Oryzias melastigma]